MHLKRKQGIKLTLKLRQLRVLISGLTDVSVAKSTFGDIFVTRPSHLSAKKKKNVNQQVQFCVRGLSAKKPRADKIKPHSFGAG